MKIDEMEEGGVYELDCQNEETREPETVRFTVIEIGWYPSPVKLGVFFQGIKVHLTDDPAKEEHVVSFITALFARKVEPAGT